MCTEIGAIDFAGVIGAEFGLGARADLGFSTNAQYPRWLPHALKVRLQYLEFKSSQCLHL